MVMVKMKKIKQEQKDEKVPMVGQQGHVVVGLVRVTRPG